MKSENLPSFCLLIGYSGSIEYLQWSLHSVQTRRDKKGEAKHLRHSIPHGLLGISTALALFTYITKI